MKYLSLFESYTSITDGHFKSKEIISKCEGKG